MQTNRVINLKDLCTEFNLELSIDNSKLDKHNIESIITIDSAVKENNAICCLHNAKYITYLKSTNAKYCITKKEWIQETYNNIIFIYHNNPYAIFAKILQELFKDGSSNYHIDNNASIDNSAQIGENCTIQAGSKICANAKIGNNVFIGANSYIGPETIIGDNTTIHDNVTIKNSVIGTKNIIHSGARIGQDGFGFAFDQGKHIKVPQLGKVIIGNDVEIGSNTCIDRGSFDDTIIGDNCKIDNLVQIGHNVKLGRSVIVVSMVGIAGSTKIGNYSVLGGQVGIAGHLNIGNNVQIAAQSGVINNIPDNSVVGGYPAVNIRDWHRQSIILKKLTKNKKNNHYDNT